MEGNDIRWDVYLDIFTGLTWGLISLTLMLLVAGMVILSKEEKRGELMDAWSEEKADNLTIMEGISISLKMLFNLSFELSLKNPASRIVIFSGSFMGYLFYAFYTSDLTAWMTSNPAPLPIR